MDCLCFVSLEFQSLCLLKITTVYMPTPCWLKHLCSIRRRRQWHPSPVLFPGKSMDRGAWWATVHGVGKSWTRLSDFTFTFHFHASEKEIATHSSVLACRIPGTGKPGGLPSFGSHRVRHDWSDLATAAAAPSEIWSLCLSFSLSLSSYFLRVQRLSGFTFLPGVLRHSQEGALHLYPIERVPEASMNRASPVPGALLAFCLNQGISAAFSPLLSYHRLRTTRFRSIKGPQHKV